MKIKLSIEVYNYLSQNTDINKFSSIMEKIDNIIWIAIEEDNIDIIRDWVMEKQILVGYDVNYDLTEEGQFLQEIIDIFDIKT